VTLCAVCTMHKETRSVGFLVWPQKRGRRFLPVWPQNRWLQVSRFGCQNRQLWFVDLGFKITVTVSWFGPQNHVGYGFSTVPQNQQDDEDSTGHASRSSSLLCLEASQARVSQSGSKLPEAQRIWCMWLLAFYSHRITCKHTNTNCSLHPCVF
jgi:hypothetical protein